MCTNCDPPSEWVHVDQADCAHILHEWPLIGAWHDYTCALCGQNWRLPWRDPFPAIPRQPSDLQAST